MNTLNPEDRKTFAKSLNDIKNQITHQIEKRFKDFENQTINEKLKVKSGCHPTN